MPRRIDKSSQNPYTTIIGEQQHRVGIEFNTGQFHLEGDRTRRLLDRISHSKLLINDREILNLAAKEELIFSEIKLGK